MHVTVESLMGSLLHAVHGWAHSCSVCSQALCSWGYKFHPHCWILWLGYIFILILRCDSYVVELTCSPPESGNGASDYDSPSTKWFSFERVLIYGCPNIVPFFTCGSKGTVKWTWVGQMADLLCFHGHYLVVDSLVAFGMWAWSIVFVEQTGLNTNHLGISVLWPYIAGIDMVTPSWAWHSDVLKPLYVGSVSGLNSCKNQLL